MHFVEMQNWYTFVEILNIKYLKIGEWENI